MSLALNINGLDGSTAPSEAPLACTHNWFVPPVTGQELTHMAWAAIPTFCPNVANIVRRLLLTKTCWWSPLYVCRGFGKEVFDKGATKYHGFGGEVVVT